MHEALRSVIRIPVGKPLQTAERDLPIDPYLYGYWLGNGCATKPEITVCDGDLQAVMANIPYRAYNTICQPGSVRVYYHELRKILCRPFVIRLSQRLIFEPPKISGGSFCKG